MCWASFLEQLSCRCGGGLARLSAQPALLGMSALETFPLEATSPPASEPMHTPSAVCPLGWGQDRDWVSTCCEPVSRLGTGPASVQSFPVGRDPRLSREGETSMPGSHIFHGLDSFLLLSILLQSPQSPADLEFISLLLRGLESQEQIPQPHTHPSRLLLLLQAPGQPLTPVLSLPSSSGCSSSAVTNLHAPSIRSTSEHPCPVQALSTWPHLFPSSTPPTHPPPHFPVK